MKQSRYNVSLDSGAARYVYNGVTGALVRLAPDEQGALDDPPRDGTDPRFSADLLHDLVRSRVLVPDDCDEIDLLRQRYAAGRQRADRLGLTIVTSLGCNLDCPYCFESKHASVLRPRTEDAVLRLVDDRLPALSELRVTWYGGEPLVGKRALLRLSDKLISRCDAGGVSYAAGMITNGYLLGEATARELAARRVRSVQVTLDGPAHIHDRMRPLVSGGGTFERIVENLRAAVEHLSVRVRVNVDRDNLPHVGELLERLAREGFAGKIGVYPGQIVAVDDGAPAPSATYGAHRCFTSREFAEVQQAFAELAAQHGFDVPRLPRPIATPCTAVRENELVVGSDGELYKCVESVGNPNEVIGTIFDYADVNGRLRKWLAYDPFSDEECLSCIALPVCMGGCAHHAMDPRLSANRCDTFRWNYREQVQRFVDART